MPEINKITMNNLIKLGVITLMFFSIASTNTYAQKYGYVNSAELLANLPEVKKADASLTTLQNQMQNKGQEMVQELQGKYEKLAQQEKQGILSPKQLQEEATKLRSEEQEIAKYEQEMVQTISKKREELLQPILDKVNNVINSVAKEKGYSMILDSSTGVILYAEENDDITSLVKSKLGL